MWKEKENEKLETLNLDATKNLNKAGGGTNLYRIGYEGKAIGQVSYTQCTKTPNAFLTSSDTLALRCFSPALGSLPWRG